MHLETERLILRPWQPRDRDPFAAMNADAQVMADLGGPLSREASDAKYERFDRVYEENGFTRWVLEGKVSPFLGEFMGYTGLVPVPVDHPLGMHYDIGWRLVHSAWGNGFACEAARAALDDAFTRCGLDEVLAYTAPSNSRSQSVMAKLGLTRDAGRDFSKDYDELGTWNARVWSARPTAD